MGLVSFMVSPIYFGDSMDRSEKVIPNLADVLDDIKQIEEEFRKNNRILTVRGERLCRDLKYCKIITKIAMKNLRKEGYRFRKIKNEPDWWEFTWEMYHGK